MHAQKKLRVKPELDLYHNVEMKFASDAKNLGDTW